MRSDRRAAFGTMSRVLYARICCRKDHSGKEFMRLRMMPGSVTLVDHSSARKVSTDSSKDAFALVSGKAATAASLLPVAASSGAAGGGWGGRNKRGN